MSSLSMQHPYRRWPKWYKGDFHAHTHRSDGVLSAPELLAHSQENGLDFFSITDHNILDAHGEFGEYDDTLIIPGTEVTMGYGHFNVFGVTEEPGWMASLPKTREEYKEHMETGSAEFTPNELLKLIKSEGYYTSINHPILPPWSWLDNDTDLRHVDFVEIWNDPSWPGNDEGTPAAVDMWSRWLNAGIRKTAIGGSDFHTPFPATQKDGSILTGNKTSQPTTHVYANNLSGQAIMDGLLARRAYVSSEPVVAFGANFDGTILMIGDDAGQIDGEMTLQATVQAEGRIMVEIVRNGSVMASVVGGGTVSMRSVAAVSAETAAWFRVDVRDASGKILAVTNPIFTGPQPTPVSHRFGDYL